MIDPRLKLPALEADFEAVIDSIRKNGTITNSVVSGGSTTLTTNNALSINQVVLINGVGCRVNSASSTEIVVNKEVEDATEWKAEFPYFMDGHITEIAKRLSEKDKSCDNVIAYTKYPLVVLLQDIDYEQSKAASPTASINFLIVNGTEGEYITEQRRVNNFEPILDPIYNDLINALRDNAYFSISKNDFKTSRRYYWGSNDMDKNPFNDRLDAIEISNVELELKIKC